MKDRPILFSSSMVNAILSGAKTQTRRVVKLDGRSGYEYIQIAIALTNDGSSRTELISPFGVPGDRLWVQEAWTERSDGIIRYRATDEKYCVQEYLRDVKWKPSIHMPRWASRITLEITSVRVERLQEITEEDAESEGVMRISDVVFDADLPMGVDDSPYLYARDGFRDLWNSLSKPGFTWADNPWVWVIGFKKV